MLIAITRVSASSRIRSRATRQMEPARACPDTRASFARAFAPRDGTVMAASTIARAKMVLFVIALQVPARARRDSKVAAVRKRAPRARLARTAHTRALAGMVPDVIDSLASATVYLVSMVTAVNASAPMEGLA